MLNGLKNLVPIELGSQWINKSYAKKVTLGQAIVFLINIHQYLLLLRDKRYHFLNMRRFGVFFSLKKKPKTHT